MTKKVCLLGAEGLLYASLGLSHIAAMCNQGSRFLIERANEIISGVAHL